MWRRLILVASALIVLGAWAICGHTYATNGGGGYNGGIFALLILVAASFTIGSGVTVVTAWREGAGVLIASVVSILASFSTLVLAIAINARG